MGRTSKIVTSGVLICALAAVSVPVGMELVPAFLPKDPAAVAVIPAVQLAPTHLSQVSGISPLSAEAPLPDPAALSADLKKALRYDGAGTFSVYVTDALTGQELFAQDSETARIPASNLKLLTAAAALKTLGPDTRFSTRAVTGEEPNEILLVAGGDSMLGASESKSGSAMGHAGLATLAKDTARTLAADGVGGPVTLAIDDTIFIGAALNHNWAKEDVEAGEIAPIFPMALNAARFAVGDTGGPRPQDSSVAVAEAFAKELEKAGVPTTGSITRDQAQRTPATEKAGQPGKLLASVESATVAEQTQYMLDESDNYVAEVLGRMVAQKLGKPASSGGAVAAVREVVTGLGLSMNDVVTVDNCGLATGNLISPKRLVQLLSMMLADPASDIAQALPGLPIAGLTGSLTSRFGNSASLDGAGLVRAKTGSLLLVTALSGYVVNDDGRLLVFSMLGNGLSDGAAGTRPVLDAAASVLARS